jgi:hypothetical protein
MKLKILYGGSEDKCVNDFKSCTLDDIKYVCSLNHIKNDSIKKYKCNIKNLMCVHVDLPDIADYHCVKQETNNLQIISFNVLAHDATWHNLKKHDPLKTVPKPTPLNVETDDQKNTRYEKSMKTIEEFVNNKPTIICLQECDGTYFDKIKVKLDYDGYKNTLASTFSTAILYPKSLNVELGKSEHNGSKGFTKIKLGDLSVISVHTSSNKRDVVGHKLISDTQKVIVCGDFNNENPENLFTELANYEKDPITEYKTNFTGLMDQLKWNYDIFFHKGINKIGLKSNFVNKQRADEIDDSNLHPWTDGNDWGSDHALIMMTIKHVFEENNTDLKKYYTWKDTKFKDPTKYSDKWYNIIREAIMNMPPDNQGQFDKFLVLGINNYKFRFRNVNGNLKVTHTVSKEFVPGNDWMFVQNNGGNNVQPGNSSTW